MITSCDWHLRNIFGSFNYDTHDVPGLWRPSYPLHIQSFYIEAVTKWPPFCRRSFQMHFLEWKCRNWQLLVQPLMKILLKWHFHFSVYHFTYHMSSQSHPHPYPHLILIFISSPSHPHPYPHLILILNLIPIPISSSSSTLSLSPSHPHPQPHPYPHLILIFISSSSSSHLRIHPMTSVIPPIIISSAASL